MQPNVLANRRAARMHANNDPRADPSGSAQGWASNSVVYQKSEFGDEQSCVIGHSITRFARSNTDCGIVRPSALAVFPLMSNSSFVDCSTGRSPGLAPLKILST